jgi:hypothetical protein
MTDAGSHRSERFTFTADELRAAMGLVDPTARHPDEWYDQVANAPPESPWLLPIRVGVALTVVSERLRRIADAEWTAAETRRVYLAERALLERVARGEAAPPGLG